MIREDEMEAEDPALHRAFGAVVDAVRPGVGVWEGEALIVFDEEGRIVEADEQAHRDLGYGENELQKLSIEDVSSRQTAAGFHRLVEVVRTEGPQRLFGYNRRKDGSSYSVETRIWLETSSGRDLVHCSMRDAGGYHDLIEERDQLISLIEHSSDAIAVTSPAGICSYMNPAGLEMVGIPSVEELTGRSILDLHPEREHRDLVERILPEVSRGRWQGELVYRNLETGAETPCLTSAFAVGHARDGAVVGLAFVAHDLTQRKSAEQHRERLLELTKISRNVATSLLERDDLHEAIGIILLGVGRILGVARSFLCRYRESRSVIIRTHQWNAGDRKVQQLLREAQSSEPYEAATRILLRGEVIRFDDVSESPFDPQEGGALLRPDAKAIIMLPVIIRGQLESFFGFIETQSTRHWEDEEVSVLQIIVDSFARAVERRIAERERMSVEEALEKSLERERRANRYKSDFLASMSHELRTPMNAIVGYAELLSRPNIDAPKQAAWLGNIRKSTDHLLSLVNDVLDLSKIEAGQMTLQFQTCELKQLIDDVLDLMKGIAEEKLLYIRVEEDGPLPVQIRTDPVRFKQILINLVGNAIKFTNEGGVTLNISAAPGRHGQPARLRVAVIDTGIGMSAEALEDLFQPFIQVHSGGARRFAGTGLGLDISRQLARLLGGEIAVDSEPDVGSNFILRIALPLLDPGEADGSSTAESDEDGEWTEEVIAEELEGRRILVVDDSGDNREVLRFLLQEAGCHFVGAENGALGVRAALDAEQAGRPFDAILMDVNMPVMSGVEATTRLLEAGVKVPIIALTAMVLADDAEMCKDAGCVAYITKPVVPRAFFRAIARHLPPRETDAGQRSGATPVAAGFSLADNPRFAPLIKRYVGSFPTQIERIQQAFREGALDDVRTLVHRIRGTASNYGFPEVTAAAGACEDALRAEAPEEEISEALEVLLERLASIAAE